MNPENAAKDFPSGKKNDDSQGPKERLWSGIFLIIIGITLCCFLVGQGSNAGTSVYLERIGSTTELAGIGAFTFSIAAAVARIVSGPLIDTRGRSIIMIIGAVIMLCGTLGPLGTNEGAAFIFWRALQGLGFAAATTASATAAADVLPLSRLGEGIGYYGLGQAISMSIGPALAIFLISTDPPENFYIGLTICALLALLLALTCRYEKHPQNLPATAEYRTRWEQGLVGRREGGSDEPQLSSASPAQNDARGELRGFKKVIDSIFEPSAIPGTIPMMIMATCFGFGIYFIGVVGHGFGVGNSGMFYTMSAISMIVIRLASGRFMDRVRPIFIMGAAVTSGLICYGMLFACTQMGGSPLLEWVFYFAGIFYGLALGVSIPINQTIAVKGTKPQRWGAANGLFLLGSDISIGFSAFFWGLALGSFGTAPTLLIVAAFIFVSFLVALICYPKARV